MHDSVSVIIPTHNRKDSVLRTLDSLRRQTYPSAQFEAIVVDDGSVDGTDQLAWDAFPFMVHYRRQEKAGATVARNAGALGSSSPILIFMDDDIVASPSLVEYLVQDLVALESTIVLAMLVPVVDGCTSAWAAAHSPAYLSLGAAKRHRLDAMGSPLPGDAGSFVRFAECMTGTLAVRRQDFFALQMFQDPTGGWPNWDDVDFGYRAHLQGFRFWRSHRAVAYHHDLSLRSLELAGDRVERAARSGVRLLRRYPDLQQHIPMFHDKGPVRWGQDSSALVARKLLRQAVSSRPAMAVMMRAVLALERHAPESTPLRLLYRWILSGYVYRGYRQGLQEAASDQARQGNGKRAAG